MSSRFLAYGNTDDFQLFNLGINLKIQILIQAVDDVTPTKEHQILLLFNIIEILNKLKIYAYPVFGG